MRITGSLLSIIGASCLVVFANTAPALADVKPCCRNDGQYFNSSPSTCRKHGGRVVDQRYCQRGYYGPSQRGSGVNFSITLGNVVFGYSDGYYDQDRRWHGWRNDDERNWYQQNHRDSFFGMNHDGDNDRYRRDWRDGKRKDWRGDRN